MTSRDLGPLTHLEFDAFDVLRATVPEGKIGLFVMSVPENFLMTTEPPKRMAEMWAFAWEKAGATKTPGLILLPEGMALSPLHDAQLESLGLMRIPTGDK